MESKVKVEKSIKDYVMSVVFDELIDKGHASEASDICEKLLKGNKSQREEIISKCELDSIRACSVCGALMFEGYLHEGSSVTYCSKECAIKDMGEDEFNEDLVDEDGNGPLFWTAWEW